VKKTTGEELNAYIAVSYVWPSLNLSPPKFTGKDIIDPQIITVEGQGKGDANNVSIWFKS